MTFHNVEGEVPWKSAFETLPEENQKCEILRNNRGTPITMEATYIKGEGFRLKDNKTILTDTHVWLWR